MIHHISIAVHNPLHVSQWPKINHYLRGKSIMTVFKSSLKLTLISLLTCSGLAMPALATPDNDNSIRAADFEGNVNNGGLRKIKGDVTATDDLQDFRHFLLTSRSNLRRFNLWYKQ